MPEHKSKNKIAERVIEKAGGVSTVASITGHAESWVHRWTYTKESGGTGGDVPQKAQQKLVAAGAASAADFFASADTASAQ